MSRALRSTLVAALLALLSAVALVVLARPAHAAGKAEVSFVEAARFSDVGRSAIERERTLQTLAAYLEELGRTLPDGQTLSVQVLDVDLAGEQIPLRWDDARVLRGGADVPHIHLRWTLSEGGRTLKSGEERLADLGYLSGSAHANARYGTLAYEKRMLAAWFAQRFGPAR